ncbi:MAG TPA: TIGR03668 family PPOX class F420-dependent oxidoreductase [Solirubrobacteraceae bacterium]|nr:TIGR03668 family PPOX class F420-dependent oxidoreductase [Solirubrobacteraceae bacterium]
MSPERARARFAAARVARLATADADGRPHVVPIAFAVAGDRVYSAVDDKPKRTRELRRLADVAANPAVSLLVDHYEEDWSALWWVRADGRGQVLDDGAPEAGQARALLAARYPQQHGAGTVLAVTVEWWHGWEASAS